MLIRDSVFCLLSVGLLLIIPGSTSAEARLPMEIQLKIKKEHWHNSFSSIHSPRFLHTMTMRRLDDLVKVALKKGTKILQKSGTHIHHHTFPKSIGYNSRGERSYSLRIVTDLEGKILIVHPV